MELPCTIGKFELFERINEGAFAVVYKALNKETKEIVAVKKMKKMSKKDAEMVKKEITIMKELKHKNIVQYKEDFREKGQWYIVLEYCGKGDMEQFKKKVGKIPEQHCKLFVRGILEALVELHKKKIAHRDLKLANILINDDYKLKLADFGFSKDYESGYMISFCGTPLSMAPEILKRQNYNQKCDVWSLGVLTYMMLYNKPPYFPTKVDGIGIPGITNAVTKRNHKFDEGVQVSEAGKQFMNDCLKKNMNDRPTTAQLLNHQWFEGLYQNQMSNMRMQAIKQSYKDEESTIKRQAFRLCEIMLYGVFEEHLKKVGQVMLLNPETLHRIEKMYLKYYQPNKKILQYYFLTVLKKLQSLGERDVIYMLFDKSFKLNLQKLKKFKEFEKELACLVENEAPYVKQLKEEKINIERQIIKFCINETDILMECANDDQITEKLYLLKSLCKFATTEYADTKIEIQWGQRSDYQKYDKFVIEFMRNLKEDIIVDAITEEPMSDEDLQSTWLIENQITESPQKKSMDAQLGKLALYVLNIPSNFTVDKTVQIDKIALNEEDYWPSDVKP